ncbi:Low molecular weight phosphotyrosine protein phosphatase [Stieleria neptunia]|uniref:Low molecular weight phosphotyrosine protein phosphatase n=1 Tax=Stieleria neptunia TaxID=2527979 RepID=A0A518HIC6_9BACT|nr:protein tyrosine phosphatase [Stieleria neptunia]QDV40597.1 Low molecular weight phosphotyrosine protein phosphatase [Stieleria neptunia]
MTDRINVLFVCSKNQWRSPTAEAVYRDDPRVSARSRGTTRSARQTIQAGDLAWADLVLVMEDKHRHRLLADFPGETRFLTVEVLHIPDDYQLMDPELVELIRVATEPFIDSFQRRQRLKP